ncbi:hypothetical protein GOP47_0024947 [Adiantum capillus-veneris]|uniref:Uncharacterized protein n=1 Tax=Adiantum capillus-veneris TaxID=13818 RepID=A0A9D4U375_ADICA|nr:hypothetical protein GOP47_0024947 [Adiantum capillus-veneris]
MWRVARNVGTLSVRSGGDVRVTSHLKLKLVAGHGMISTLQTEDFQSPSRLVYQGQRLPGAERNDATLSCIRLKMKAMQLLFFETGVSMLGVLCLIVRIGVHDFGT